MNDLNFGATLFALFATIVTAIAVEASSAPASHRGATAEVRPATQTQRLATEAPTNCTTIARAPTPD